MERITASVTVRTLSLDRWSETYVGALWLAEEELPERHWQSLPRHGPLSQLVLIAAHRLVEVQLFACVRKLLDASPGKFPGIESEFPKGKFGSAFKAWPAKLVGQPFDVGSEPFLSALALQTRRNATVHKDAALCSLPMARAALFTAVEASRSIATHLLGPDGFAYAAVLRKHPIAPQPWFAAVPLVERRT